MSIFSWSNLLNYVTKLTEKKSRPKHSQAIFFRSIIVSLLRPFSVIGKMTAAIIIKTAPRVPFFSRIRMFASIIQKLNLVRMNDRTLDKA